MVKQNRITFRMGALFLLMMVTVLFSSCDWSTSPKKYSLRGIVNLQIERSVKGDEIVQVLLYKAVEQNNVISALNQSHPQHGVHASQFISFDHRKQTPLKSVTINASNEFEFDGLAPGIYNLVVLSEGIGYAYKLDIELDNDISGMQVDLYPIITLPTVIDSDYQMQSNRVYQTNANTFVLASGALRVAERCILHLHNGSTLTIEGLLDTSEQSSLLIRSQDKLFFHSQSDSSIEDYSQVNLTNVTSQEYRNLYLSDAVYGLRLVGASNVTVESSSFDSRYQSVIVQNSSGISIRSCLIQNSTDISLGALLIENASNTNVQKSVFLNNQNAIYIYTSQNTMVENNYFNGNLRSDVFSGEETVTSVEYNTFRNSNISNYNFSGQMSISRNDIEAKTGIYNWRLNASFTAQYNNLDCSEYGIKSQGWFHGGQLQPMTCTQNYWNTNNLNEIEALIYDRDNEDPSDVNYYLAMTIVVFQPYRTSPNTAGIF